MKKAIVTGASRGIGRAIAKKLAEDGFEVTANYLNSEKEALSLQEEAGVKIFRADTADFDAARSLVDFSGGADVLVINAGIALQKLLTDTTPQEWRRVFAVNTDSAYNMCHAAIPYMVRQQHGRIIIVSSVWGVHGGSCEAAYSASKAALIGLTKALAKELGPSGITVNCITPGVIDTDMNGILDPDTVAALIDETPLMRLGTAEDVAELVSFLVSGRASFITGQVIGVDGGFSL